MHKGDHVLYSLDGNTVRVGHLLENSGGDKDPVQTADGGVANLARREPADRDEHGSGETYWSV